MCELRLISFIILNFFCALWQAFTRRLLHKTTAEINMHRFLGKPLFSSNIFHFGRRIRTCCWTYIHLTGACKSSCKADTGNCLAGHIYTWLSYLFLNEYSCFSYSHFCKFFVSFLFIEWKLLLSPKKLSRYTDMGKWFVAA